jgi:hypothetical protein
MPLLKEYATRRVAREGEQIASSAMMTTNRRALEIQERLWNEARQNLVLMARASN